MHASMLESGGRVKSTPLLARVDSPVFFNLPDPHAGALARVARDSLRSTELSFRHSFW